MGVVVKRSKTNKKGVVNYVNFLFNKSFDTNKIDNNYKVNKKA